jgi:hypothetical protein
VHLSNLTDPAVTTQPKEGAIMLFVGLATAKPGADTEAVISRRMEWEYPPGFKVIAEYWLQHPDPNLVIVAEADSVASIMAVTTRWEDVWDITVVPAVTAEEGIALIKSMTQ